MAKNDKYKGFVNLGASIRHSLGFLKNHNYNPALLILNKNWLEIIGERYYKYCKPEKIYFKKNQKGNGVLYVVVYSPVLSMYIDSNKNFILDKINTFFGYKAVADLKIKQVPKLVEDYCKKKKTKTVNKTEEQEFLSNVNQSMNEGLKEELEELGRSMLKYRGKEN